VQQHSKVNCVRKLVELAKIRDQSIVSKTGLDALGGLSWCSCTTGAAPALIAD